MFQLPRHTSPVGAIYKAACIYAQFLLVLDHVHRRFTATGCHPFHLSHRSNVLLRVMQQISIILSAVRLECHPDQDRHPSRVEFLIGETLQDRPRPEDTLALQPGRVHEQWQRRQAMSITKSYVRLVNLEVFHLPSAFLLSIFLLLKPSSVNSQTHKPLPERATSLKSLPLPRSCTCLLLLIRNSFPSSLRISKLRQPAF